MGTNQLYIRCTYRVTIVGVKFEFNDKSLYMKNDSERKQSFRQHHYLCLFHNIFFENIIL